MGAYTWVHNRRSLKRDQERPMVPIYTSKFPGHSVVVSVVVAMPCFIFLFLCLFYGIYTADYDSTPTPLLVKTSLNKL